MDDEDNLLDAIRGDTPEPTPPPAEARHFNGWWILLVLLCPLFISLFVLMVDGGDYGGNGLVALLFACPVAGIVAGCLFAGRLRNLSDGQRIAAGFGMSIVFTVASIALAYGGCMLLFAGGIVK